MRGGFARIYMSLPECIEGCPQHESMQPRRAYGPWTLLPGAGKFSKKECRRGVQGAVQVQHSVHEVPVAQMAHSTPPGKLQIVFMFKPQPSLNTASSGVINAGSPWLVYQVSSEVFSKTSFVMSSLLFWGPKSCKLQIVFMFALQPSLKM